jgi:uncharacterized membrane protein (UPF0127 family)
MEIRVARTFFQRLVGLAWRRRAEHALLIPRCRCVHTFGMRFPLDLVWLDAGGAPLRIDRNVPPRRVTRCAGAAAVLEYPAAAFRAAGFRPGDVLYVQTATNGQVVLTRTDELVDRFSGALAMGDLRQRVDALRDEWR